MKKLLISLAAAVALVLGFGVPAGASAYPPGGTSVTVDPASGSAGFSFDVTANCTPGETVTFTFQGATMTATCSAGSDSDSGGTATATFTAPSDAGRYTGSVTGSVSDALGSFAVTVEAEETTTTAAPTTDAPTTDAPTTAAPATDAPTTAAPVTTPSGGLPATGSDGIGTTTGIAIGLLIMGLGLFAVATVRRSQPGAA